MARFPLKPLFQAIKRVATETNLKEAEKKVVSRAAGEETLDPKQALPTEEELKLPEAPPEPTVPSPDQKLVSDEPVKPELEPPVEKPGVLDERPLNDEELESLLDAADNTLEGDPKYTNLNLRRVTTVEDIGSVADRMIEITMKRGDPMQPRTTHRKIEKDASRVAWGTITNKQRAGIPLSIEEINAAREVEAKLMSDIKRRANEHKDLNAAGELGEQAKVELMQDAAKVMAISRYLRGEVRRAAQIVNSQAIVVDAASSISARQRN